MRIVTPTLIVEENDAFKNDVLDRKPFGVALLNLIERSSDELVISLDGRWGEGKTTFVKMWQGLLSESNIPNLYIDAFANDYVDDAFIVVASAITSYVEANIVKDKIEKITELKDKAKKVGGQFLTWSAKLAIKAATLGVIKDSDLEELKDIQGDLAKGASEVVGDFIEERLTSHAQDVELIESFKGLLSEIPSQLENNDNKPLVIIIDELDRCKPTFAVEVIEKIKHLFSVKHIVFVLVMNKEQLEEAVKCVYGRKIDAHTYLQKFITIEAKLPKRLGSRHINDLSKYSQQLLQLHELKTWGDETNILDCIEPLANHLNLSLRELEKTYTNLAILYAASAPSHLRLVPIIVLLSVIKVVNPPIFDKLLHQRISYDEVCSKMGLTDFDDERNNYGNLPWIKEWLRYTLLTDQEFQQLDDDDQITSFDQSLQGYHVSRKMLIPLFAQKLSMFVAN